MATIRYHDEAGKECTVHWPPQTLSQALDNYRPCGAEDETMTTQNDSCMDRMEAGRQLHTLAKQEQARHPERSYAENLAITKSINGDLVRAYAGVGELSAEKQYATSEASRSGRTPAAEVHYRMQLVKRQHPGLDLAKAKAYVLAKDPALKAQYTGKSVVIYEDEQDVIAISWPKSVTLEVIYPRGRRKVERIIFDGTQGWTLAKVNEYLTGMGVKAKRVVQEGSNIVAVMLDPGDNL